MKVIALYAAKSRVGKDTVGNLLCKRLSDEGFVVIPLKVADHLKAACHNIFKDIGVAPGKMYEERSQLRDVPLICPLTIQTLEPDVVDVWIAIGECCKSLWKHVWISKTIRDIHDLAETGVDYVVITDCREDFEITALQDDFPTLVIEVESTERGVKRAMDGRVTIKPDFVIRNDSTLEDLANSEVLEAAFQAAVSL